LDQLAAPDRGGSRFLAVQWLTSRSVISDRELTAEELQELIKK
jgi:hypothetical protein